VTKVLVVDDEPDIRRLVGFSLKRHGFDVVEATDGLAACAVAEAEQPDIILMDVMMPLMNGFVM
jgi:CheY-like chemotaxis protein